MIELILALILQLVTANGGKHDNASKNKTINSQSTTTEATIPGTSTTEYDGGQNHWETKD